MSHAMTEQPTTPSSGQPLERFERCINSGSEAVEQYCREEILFRAFETNDVDYYSETAVCYPLPAIQPTRFRSFGCRVEPVGDGYHVEVEATYPDEAPIAPLEDDPDAIDTLGENELRDVIIQFDADASIGYRGCFLDATVMVSQTGGDA